MRHPILDSPFSPSETGNPLPPSKMSSLQTRTFRTFPGTR